MLPRIRLPPCHHIEIRIAVDVTVLNAFPHIDEEDLDLWFRPTQAHQGLIRPTRQRLQPISLRPRANSFQMRIRRPWIRREFENARLNINKPQVSHPPSHPVGDAELPGRIRCLARSDVKVKPVNEGVVTEGVWVFRRHGAVVALWFGV